MSSDRFVYNENEIAVEEVITHTRYVPLLDYEIMMSLEMMTDEEKKKLKQSIKRITHGRVEYDYWGKRTNQQKF